MRRIRKGKTKKRVIVHSHSFEGGITEILERLDKFTEQWASKFNSLSSDFQMFKQASIMQFGHVEANERILAEAIDKVDTNLLAFSKVLKAIYGQLEQSEEILSLMSEKNSINIEELPINMDEILDRAAATYRRAVAEAFSATLAEKKAHEEAVEAAKKAEQEEAKRAKEEAIVAEKALKDAEIPRLDALAGGQGSDIPDGALVFGD